MSSRENEIFCSLREVPYATKQLKMMTLCYVTLQGILDNNCKVFSKTAEKKIV